MPSEQEQAPDGVTVIPGSGRRIRQQPGSALAGDDKIRPAVSELARFGIATAVDHMKGVRLLR